MVNIQSAASRIHVLEVVGNAITGGMETSVARLVEHLPSQRFAVSALCPFESPYTDQLRALGADVYVTPMFDDPAWSSIQIACALVRSSSVDVLHAHLPNAHVLAGIAGRLCGKPVLATIHGRQLSSLDLEVHRASGTHINVVCQQSYFHALGVGVHPSQLHCIANGVDTDVFTPRRDTSGPLRRRFGIPPPARVVGFVGRLSPEKGPEVFLRAAAAVREASPETRFLVVGDGPMRAQLESFIAQFRLESTVHLAGMQQDVPAAMAELDMLILSSHSEAMPLVVMEAMASGLPVIASRVGGIPALLQHGVTGWLAQDGDYEGMASRVLDLVRDPDLLATTGAQARQRAVERMSLGDTIADIARLLTRLAQSRHDARRIAEVARDGELLDGSVAPNDKAALA